MKTLFFEGAGWDKAESNGVGNCRIRATFKDKKGRKIYFELRGFERPKHCITAQEGFVFPWWISHLFYLKDKDKHYSDEFLSIDRTIKEYTIENILNFVNTELNCNYSAIIVCNDGEYNGFDCQ